MHYSSVLYNAITDGKVEKPINQCKSSRTLKSGNGDVIAGMLKTHTSRAAKALKMKTGPTNAFQGKVEMRNQNDAETIKRV